MKEISSKENQIIKEVVQLKEAKYRKQKKLFLIEGRTMLWEAINSQQKIVRVLVEKKQKEIYLREFGDKLNCEWIAVSESIMKYVCDTKTPQGIAAVLGITELDFANKLAEYQFLIYLDQISDPGNLGTILRTAWGFGVQAVLLSPGCVDPYNPKVVRSSMGAIFNIPVFQDVSVYDLLQAKSKGYRIFASSLQTDRFIDNIDFSGSIIIVIGSEAHGVDDSIITISDAMFKIPIITQVDSLNAGVACGIIIYEAYRQRGN
jgi:TrmH family RNA methyltransferase